MTPLRTVPVDVRDMLCAQALAVVAQALQREPAPALFEILTNTPDVRRDLAVWARERGYRLTARGGETLVMERLPA